MSDTEIWCCGVSDGTHRRRRWRLRSGRRRRRRRAPRGCRARSGGGGRGGDSARQSLPPHCAQSDTVRVVLRAYMCLYLCLCLCLPVSACACACACVFVCVCVRSCRTWGHGRRRSARGRYGRRRGPRRHSAVGAARVSGGHGGVRRGGDGAVRRVGGGAAGLDHRGLLRAAPRETRRRRPCKRAL